MIGDRDAKGGEFPYQVWLQVIPYELIEGYYGYFCGGSIINETWVLTSGRCLSHVSELKKQNGTVVVKAGKLFVDRVENGEQTAHINSTYPHEKFDPNQ